MREPTPAWWRSGIIYQIYVRSFYDTNNDGIGDLPGVIAKLDYVKSLGVQAIWLSPITVSANADWGYDVVDYRDVDPALGTMADFDRLVREAKRRDIKILVDLVPNHTSTQHPWFKNALTGRDAEYRDYYIWADPKPGGRPPSNWRSYFGGGAWTLHRETGQYYLHNFLPQQAELNWRNPQVRDEFDGIMKFWLAKGVAGFRIDVFNMLIKDAKFRDNPRATSDDWIELRLLGQRPTYNVSQPEVHDILKRWRKLADSYSQPRLLLGETTLVFDVRKVAAFYGMHDELDLAFNFGFTQSKFEAPSLRRVVEETDKAIKGRNWPVWTISNHDQSRFPSRWARGDERKIRCGLLTLLALEGTPVLYYGDELGMVNTFIPPWNLKDPLGRRFWPVDAGRDKVRTPMPWKDQPGAGFTKAGQRPWLPYGDLRQRNVAGEEKAPDSTLQFARDVIALRQASADLNSGSYKTIKSVPEVWAWQRGRHTALAINLSDQRHAVGLAGKIVISTNRQRQGQAVKGRLELAPWEGVIVQRP